MKRRISLALVIVMLLTLFPVVSAAETGVSTMANYIVFVRFRDDADNTFSSAERFSEIKKIYDYYPSPYADTVGASALDKSLDVSFKNFVKTVSRGKLLINNVFPQALPDGTASILTLSFNEAALTDASQIIEEVLNASNNGALPLGTEKLDNREAGVLDNLTIIVQYDHEIDDSSAPLYSHKGNGGTSTLLGNRYYIGTYNLMTSYTVLDDFTMKQGVVTHEFLHSVGLPDLYRYTGTGSPVGRWDIMSSTGAYMQYPLSYLRHLYGWVPMETAVTTGHYTLNAADSPTGDVVLKIKTPMSDSEFFCVEYRRQMTGTMANLGFETKLPDSGLLLYRVNNGMEYLTNKTPDNDYLYVFRPGETGLHDSAGQIADATLNPDKSETAWGSADFSAGFTENTLFYADGSNSGVTITNVAYSADKSQISFDVTFPDFTALGLWKKRAVLANDGSFGTDIAVAHGGDVYTAVCAWGDKIETVIQKQSGLVSTVLARLDSAATPLLGFAGDTLWCVHQNANGDKLILRKYQDGSFFIEDEISCENYYFSTVKLFSDADKLYLAVVDGGTEIKIYELTDAGPILMANSLTASGDDTYANPAFAAYHGSFFVLYSVFGGWGSAVETGTHLKTYDPLSDSWTEVASYSTTNLNTHALAVTNDTLYGLAGGSGTPFLLQYNGTSCSTQPLSFASGVTVGLSMTAADGFVAVSLISQGGASEIFVKDGTGDFAKLGGTVSSDTQSIALASDTNRIWALYTTTTGGMLSTKAVRKPLLHAKAEYVQQVSVLPAQKYLILPQLTDSLPALTTLTNGGTLNYAQGGYLGTGKVIQILDADGDLSESYITVVRSDLNGDGIVDVLDAALSEAALNGHLTPDGATLAAADADGDETLRESDFSLTVNTALLLSAT